MMQSVSKNPVFQRMMGVRYIVSDSDVPGYTLVKKCGTTGIYQNKDAAPVMYATDRVMTEEEYKKLAFPYNQTAIFGICSCWRTYGIFRPEHNDSL